jgi:hypothetical protein
MSTIRTYSIQYFTKDASQQPLEYYLESDKVWARIRVLVNRVHDVKTISVVTYDDHAEVHKIVIENFPKAK